MRGERCRTAPAPVVRAPGRADARDLVGVSGIGEEARGQVDDDVSGDVPLQVLAGRLGASVTDVPT